jgi:hypothetical protein
MPEPTPPPAAQYRMFPDWWRPGQPHPLIDASSPAVAQAVGRCLTARVMVANKLNMPALLPSKAYHPSECDWCVYPVAQLREAIGYAAWVSKYDMVLGEYHNPAWAQFFAGVTPRSRDLPPEEWHRASARRHELITSAMYGDPT